MDKEELKQEAKGDLYKIWIIFSVEKKKQTDTQDLRVFGLKQTLLNLQYTNLLMQRKYKDLKKYLKLNLRRKNK